MTLTNHDEALLRKLSSALAENPRANTTQLAAAAGISRATFNRIFGSREHLLELIEQRAADCISEIEETARTANAEDRAVLESLVAAHFDNQEYIVFSCSEQDHLDGEYWKSYLGALDSFFARGQESGSFRIDLPAPLLTELFVSTISGLIDGQMRGRVARAGMLDAATSFFLSGSKRR